MAARQNPLRFFHCVITHIMLVLCDISYAQAVGRTNTVLPPKQNKARTPKIAS